MKKIIFGLILSLSIFSCTGISLIQEYNNKYEIIKYDSYIVFEDSNFAFYSDNTGEDTSDRLFYYFNSIFHNSDYLLCKEFIWKIESNTLWIGIQYIEIVSMKYSIFDVRTDWYPFTYIKSILKNQKNLKI